MGSIGLLALAANVISAGLLIRHRDGDINMRSVWLCSRNDAIANIAVILAAVIAGLGLTSGAQIIKQARGQLRTATA